MPPCHRVCVALFLHVSFAGGTRDRALTPGSKVFHDAAVRAGQTPRDPVRVRHPANGLQIPRIDEIRPRLRLRQRQRSPSAERDDVHGCVIRDAHAEAHGPEDRGGQLFRLAP